MTCHLAYPLRRSSLKHVSERVALLTQNMRNKDLVTMPCRPWFETFCVMFRTVHYHHLHHTVKYPHPQYPVLSLFSSTKRNLDLSRCKQFSSRKDPLLVKNAFKSQGPVVQFKDSDICLVFDTANALISQLTFAEAKALANKKKSRLVYMHKNKDKISCFKLQESAHTKDKVASCEISGDNTANLQGKVKPQKKNIEKEFKMKTSISDHDLNVKMVRIQALLARGKQVVVLITADVDSSKVCYVLTDLFVPLYPFQFPST